MKQSRVVVPGVVTLIMLGAVLASSAPASAVLVLKAGGQVAPVGTPVIGVLAQEPCDRFESSGTLTANSSSIDRAKFSSTAHTGAGCGEGGPLISGPVVGDRLKETGQFVVLTNWTYTTVLAPGAVNTKCTYTVRMLHGKFTIPGPTQATVSGKGKRTATSPTNCPEKLAVDYFQAKLYDAETNELFEAEL